jgi:Tol biopolymer transport system component
MPMDEAQWFRNVRQLTSVQMGLARSGEAYFSPDARRICFQAWPAGQEEYQIYVMNLDGTGLLRVSTGSGATTCSYFHPSGQKLIFASNHLDPRPPVMPEEVQRAVAQAGARRYTWPFYPGMDIFEYTFATGALRRLTTTDGYDAECAYSPDGRSIVFCSQRDGDLEIYVADANCENARQVTRAKGYDGGPFFSPDGQRVVYRSDRRGLDSGTMQIFTNNLAGTDERAVTDHEILHWCPFWHPSGQWLIYTRADHSNPRRPLYDLYLVRADGSQTYQVSGDPAFDGLPVFSADGRYLMWTSKRGGLDAPQIFMAEFTGLTPTGELRARAAPVPARTP